MATKIRLQRHGRKKKAFFHIVVADVRAPRDGRFIEKLGVYNPLTNPATIDINMDRAVEWVQNGATPSDTARAILSYKGVLYKSHLMNGVKKGALTEEQAEAKFAEWQADKTSRIEGKKTKLGSAKEALKAEKLKQEAAKREAVAAKVAAKLVVPEEPATEESAEETTEETAPAAEENNGAEENTAAAE